MAEDEPTNERCSRLLNVILAIVPSAADEDYPHLRRRLERIRQDAEWSPPWSTVAAERVTLVLSEEIGLRRDGWCGQVHKIWVTGDAG